MNTATLILLALYEETAPKSNFLSSTFAMTSRSVHNSGKVTFDIIRGGEKVAPIVTSIEDGYIKVSLDKATNKEVTPPVVKLKFLINLMNTQAREPGSSPFDTPDEMKNALLRFAAGMVNVTEQIDRNLELQASQIYQTGKMALWDENGNTAFAIDFAPKASHFPTAAVAWGSGSDKKTQDINTLAKAIRKDAKARADVLLFGEKAWESWISDAHVLELLKKNQYDAGRFEPKMNMDSGTYQGYIFINNYRYEMWTYDGVYEDSNSTLKSYIDDGNVVVMASNARREKSFGMIPKVVADDPRLSSFVTGNITANGLAITTGATIDQDNENVFGKAGTRPILLPIAIDAHACLKTGIQ
jgi:hypothetical protein